MPVSGMMTVGRYVLSNELVRMILVCAHWTKEMPLVCKKWSLVMREYYNQSLVLFSRLYISAHRSNTPRLSCPTFSGHIQYPKDAPWHHVIMYRGHDKTDPFVFLSSCVDDDFKMILEIALSHTHHFCGTLVGHVCKDRWCWLCFRKKVLLQ